MIDEKTFIEQNQLILELVETLDICRETIKKQGEIIESLKKSIWNAEQGREYWIGKYNEIVQELLDMEAEQNGGY